MLGMSAPPLLTCSAVFSHQSSVRSIKKACPRDTSGPIFAVKFINKEFTVRYGRISLRQLLMETTLHKYVSGHNNIISFLHTGEDDNWRWIAMEAADGGDLFDKIEADEGVGEDIAHVYFSQLVSAVSYMHSKGVGHRDIKPENMLVSASGDLKIADFGLATLFEYNGATKLATTFCGSPPYIAPEVISCSSRGQVKGPGYRADLVDIWSCGIVLFVLLAGNTPWDSPTDDSWEFETYVASNSRPDDELWQKLPTETLSLIRGMLKVDYNKRFTFEEVRKHPWFTRKNKYLSPDGQLRDPISMATSMFESLRIDFSKDPIAPSSSSNRSADTMELDDDVAVSSTQPNMPPRGGLMDWSMLDGPSTMDALSSTQPTSNSFVMADHTLDQNLVDEPSMSQFSQRPSVPLSRTQNARMFYDIVPSRPMTRFFSTWELRLLVPLICEALHRLGVPVTPPPVSFGDTNAVVRVVANYGRMEMLHGRIVMQCVAAGLFEVEFHKAKGDPLEWRRLFKKVAVLCKNAVCRPD